MSFLLRWIFALILLVATYNPTPWNWIQWSLEHWREQTSVAVLTGLVLFAGYVIYLRATLRSIGLFGMILVLALVAALLWVARDLGWISLSDPGFNTWIGLLAASLVLGVGLSWSIIRRKLSGQVDMDDVEE